MRRAVVFDFDGLILDTETPELESWRAIFAEHGTVYEDAYWHDLLGRGAEQVAEWPIERLERQLGRAVNRAEVEAEYQARRRAGILARRALPGVEAMLGELAAVGVPAAVASSSRHEWVDGHLDRLGLAGYFRCTCCADDVARAKPFPDLYQLALARLGVGPELAVAFEDSANGVAAAKAAGMYTVVIPNPATAGLDLSLADERVDSMEELRWAELAIR
jgi:HAD superfamily hydrolase (TIGR01509 family)